MSAGSQSGCRGAGAAGPATHAEHPEGVALGNGMCTSSFLFEKRRENRVTTPLHGRQKLAGADAPEPAVG